MDAIKQLQYYMPQEETDDEAVDDLSWIAAIARHFGEESFKAQEVDSLNYLRKSAALGSRPPPKLPKLPGRSLASSLA